MVVLHSMTRHFENLIFFYLNCKFSDPKDIWNDFFFVDNSNIDFTKVKSLLNQKSKSYFLLEKKKGNKMKCFGLFFTEDISFKNWLNRKPEMLNLKLPVKFKELVRFSDTIYLECCKYLEKEAIKYASALHISAHMFFEKN